MDNICTNAVQEVLIMGNNQQCLLPVLKVAEMRNKLTEDDPFVQELIMLIITISKSSNLIGHQQA